MRREKRYLVQLGCAHDIYLPDPPVVGVSLVCFDCGVARRVTFVRKYTADCEDCTYRNHEGDLRILSLRARTHCEGKSHTVRIWYPTLTAPVMLIPNAKYVLSSKMTA